MSGKAQGARVNGTVGAFYAPENPPTEQHKAAAAAEVAQKDQRGSVLALVEIGAELELFSDSASDAYAMLPVSGEGRRAVRLKSHDFRNWLSGQFYKRSGGTKAAADDSIRAALGVLISKALHDGPRCDVAVRVAEHGGNLYLDLANERGEAVVMTAQGWSVTAKHPVRFRVPRGLKPLPSPERDGSIDELRPLINAPGEAEWCLLVAWLVASLRPGRPLPVLVLLGEAGSAKSTTGRLLRSLIDPAEPADRTRPRDERDLAIAAKNGWVCSFDNLSGLSDLMSDALCRLSTGAGFATRELHTDTDEVLIAVLRPVMANGIDDLLHRGDLADRALRVELPVIPPGERRTLDDVLRRYEAIRPRVLGAICDGACGALARLAESYVADLPRMADFTLWGVAAEESFGWPAGTFLRHYRENRAGLVEAALDADPVATAIRRLLGVRGGAWEGTVGELLDALTELHESVPPAGWPRTPSALSNRLRRAAPHLRSVGVDLTVASSRTNRGRLYSLRKTVTTVTSSTAQRGQAPTPPASQPSRPVTTVTHSGRAGTQDFDDGDASDDRDGAAAPHPVACRCAGDGCALGAGGTP